uniref:Uncharacterized protein n=1 Tax=Apteryx owenii TaxID=8824 RepID=A0A8B9PHR3_APTOW
MLPGGFWFSLNLYHNCLRSIPPAIANLQALTYLNLSRNQLAALPACLCRLPLKVLIASNNKLPLLPDAIGALSALRQLVTASGSSDGSAAPPPTHFLAPELSELPLVRLDFSCNRVAAIPVCYRHLRHLQTILSDNNPLRSPPAQVSGAAGTAAGGQDTGRGRGRGGGSRPLRGRRIPAGPSRSRLLPRVSPFLSRLSPRMSSRICPSGSPSWPASPGS